MVTKWRLAKVTNGDLRRSQKFMELYPIANKSFITRFESFIKINHNIADDPTKLLEGLLGQFISAELKWTTVASYFKLAVQHLYANNAVPLSHRTHIARLGKAIRLQAADENILQATRASLRDLQIITSHATPGTERACFNMLMLCGGRWEDIRGLRRKQILIHSDGSITVQWRVTKNIRVSADRRAIRYKKQLGCTISDGRH